MKEKKTHLKAKPPKLPSFTACGLWIYEVNTKQVKHEKKVTSNIDDVTCKRCEKTGAYKDEEQMRV